MTKISVTCVLLALGLVATAGAQTFTMLYNFSPYTGAWPYGTLVRDSSGNLYGTTYQGGASLVGEVFELSATGTEYVLHSFSTTNDGYWPFASVFRTSTGVIYGTTFYGVGNGCGGQGCGTVIKLSAAGNETIVHQFGGGTSDGCNPYGGVILYKGYLYGTTYGCGAYADGTVFKISSKGVETIVHNFSGGASDGAKPAYGSLKFDSAGNLYGVANQGGPANWGVVFKIDPSGNETILYSFSGGADGGNPNGTLVRDSGGNLYGVTSYGGATNNGVIFKVDPSGNENVLHTFSGTDGGFPQSGPIRDGAGNLYGTAYYGGTYGEGVIWKLSSRGVYSILHSFNCSTDGCYPVGGVVRDALTKTLYGTGYYGGPSGPYGTVWRLAP